MKLNVRPAEAVRYIVEGMTKTQQRKLTHWTERTQAIEGFSDPEAIAIIELVDFNEVYKKSGNKNHNHHQKDKLVGS